MLSLKQLQHVCLLHGGPNQCRYLNQDDNDMNKFYCKKQRPNDRKKIDKKVNEYLNDCQKKNIDPTKQAHYIGDNCQGYPVLKNIPQGYDVP